MPFFIPPLIATLLTALAAGAAAAGGGALANRAIHGPAQGKGQKNMAPGGQGRAPGPQGPAPGWGGKGGGGDQLQGGNKSLWGGQSPFIERTALYEPKQGAFQSGALDQATKMLQEGLANPYQFTHNFDFQPIANEARMNFAQNTIPSILERFTALGAGGGRSGALQQQLSQAGANLESGLASQKAQQGNQWGLQREQLGLQRLGQQRALFELFSALGNRPQWDITRNPGEKGIGESLVPDLIRGVGDFAAKAGGQAIGNYFGNKAGNAAAGAGAPVQIAQANNNVAAKLAVARAAGLGK